MMTARHALLNEPPLTPWPDVRDSDEVLLALEKAREFEAEGDVPHALQWLHRAAQASTKQGEVERAQTMAHAAADLANTLEPPADTEAPGSVPTLNVRGRRSTQAPRPDRSAANSDARPRSPTSTNATSASSVPPMFAALVSAIPTFFPRASTTPPAPASGEAATGDDSATAREAVGGSRIEP